MNNYFFALLCHCITMHGCYGQTFLHICDLLSVQKTDKLDGTIESPITDGVRISWSPSSSEYKIHSTGHANIETFHKSSMRVIFMVGDLIKIIVLDTDTVWLCRFSSARWAHRFYTTNNQRELTNDSPYFEIDVVKEKTPQELQTFTKVALYMKPYGLPQSNSKMFILKSSPRAGQVESVNMIFLSGRFSIKKTGDQIGFSFTDAKDRSCTMRISNGVETVYDAISPYARHTRRD